MPRHRLLTVVGLIIILTIIITTARNTSTSSVYVPTVADLSQTVKQAAERLPSSYNPFGGPSAHAPPEQAGSSNGATKWYSDLRWLNPFSSETTLDNERALLPPLPPRQPIYTYYTPSQDAEIYEAEHELLLTWRRAWWAKGFRPIVLGQAEASKHPSFDQVQKLNLESSLLLDANRFLAFSHMSGGCLSNYLALPMTSYDDQVLAYLRRGTFDPILKFRNLKNGLICGEGHKIEAAVKSFIQRVTSVHAKSFMDALPTTSWQLVDTQDAIAYYDIDTIAINYRKIQEAITNSQAGGLRMLNELENAHLHLAWQETFPDGVAVLKPHPDRMTAIVSFALRLARDLLACPASPLPASCPPNMQSCRPCSGETSGLPLNTPETFLNSSMMFTIGTVPHPWTFVTSQHLEENLDVPFIRRETPRDSWINATTSDMLGTVLAGPQRLVHFKDAVASSFAVAHSLWVTAERVEEIQRDWLFGFALPDRRALGPPSNVRGAKPYAPSVTQLAKERLLLELARDKLQKGEQHPLMNSVSAWNLADSEAWHFVQAFMVRRRTERELWEAQESRYAGAESEGRRSAT